ncbi:MAG: hypothetical protein IPG07_13175 [Crocinitomicaceae bacterium]|nr:hypothetical protein [Crocinitomicaceae bacterium]
MGVADPKIFDVDQSPFAWIYFRFLIVYFHIKIKEKISNQKSSNGWLDFGALWMMPFLSVRNLVEITCIPFILWSVWLMLKNEKRRNFLFAGLMMGMAVSFRYQVGVFALGVAAVYFFQWKWAQFLLFSIGVLIVFGLTQGLVDHLIWGYPFAEFIGYATYNANEGWEVYSKQQLFHVRSGING